MYKQITAGNLDDLRNKMRGRTICNIYIKPLVDMQIEKMSVEEYNELAAELKAREITLVLEDKDRKLKKVILEQIPVPEKKEVEDGK